MAHHIDVVLPDHWHRFVTDAVANRRFASIDDTITAALRALDAEEDRMTQLERLLLEGEQSGDAGPWNLEEFLAERHREAGREAA